MGAVIGLAGCTDGNDDSTPNQTATTGAATTQPTTEPTTKTTTTEPPFAEVARTLVSRLASGEYEGAVELFAPDVASQVDAAQLESIWAELIRQQGAFVGIEGSNRTTVQSRTAVLITSRFAQGQQGLLVIFDEQARVLGFRLVPVGDATWSPPTYVDAQAIVTSELSVDNGASCTLPAETTVPEKALEEPGATPPPSAVFLGGSGPTDLDGSIGPNRPYRDLAYGLATKSTSSLRFTKRTAVCEVDPTAFTIDDEYTTDALAAVERTRSMPGFDNERTIIVGHSLGAKLAPRVADRIEGAAGVIMLAPPGRPLAELVLEQTRYLVELDGTVTEDEQAQLDAVAAAVNRIRKLDIGDDEIVLGGGRAYWESLAAYDAFETARSLSVPILVAWGTRDYQVTAADIDRWEQELSGQENVQFERYDGLNHLFMPGEGPGSPAEYQTLGHVAEEVVADLDDWATSIWSN
ncbi:alpha/beta fold hydrolase [Haloarchaeobius amylolyticus]|uniref:alpha/beta fold hydrolase n=1 Tax=Haloarchaeobius amylolyticus TaxID=1198296 RepID=UPI00226EBC81|nr:alpha/beta fold hydrolase [Haloarchaeobius amylolyticus]